MEDMPSNGTTRYYQTWSTLHNVFPCDGYDAINITACTDYYNYVHSVTIQVHFLARSKGLTVEAAWNSSEVDIFEAGIPQGLISEAGIPQGLISEAGIPQELISEAGIPQRVINTVSEAGIPHGFMFSRLEFFKGLGFSS